jgi:hypothetical protein
MAVVAWLEPDEAISTDAVAADEDTVEVTIRVAVAAEADIVETKDDYHLVVARLTHFESPWILLILKSPWLFIDFKPGRPTMVCTHKCVQPWFIKIIV